MAHDCESNHRVWQVGLGPMGRRLINGAAERDFEIAGASDPAHVDESLGGLVDAPGLGDQQVEARGVGEEVDVVQLATVSDAEAVASQIRTAMPRTEAVVTTCEPLAYPTGDDRSLAEQLDAEARETGTRVLAAGINPGYAMDLLPVCATAPSSGVEGIEVVRRADVSDRRGPLQKKVGAGMSPDTFERSSARGEVGHRGLEASIRLIASALDWQIDTVDEQMEGLPAETTHRTDHVDIEPGDIRGVRHVAEASGRGDTSPRLQLELVLAVGVDEPIDRVAIDGDPPLQFRVPGGLPGDVCTVNVALNYTDVLLDAEPGFHTVVDLPVPRPSDNH